MKFTLTITDASASELAKLFAALNGSTATVATTGKTAPAEQSPAAPTITSGPAHSIPPMPTNPGSDDDGEGDEQPSAPTGATHDVSGLPWDERIHSASRSTNKDGTWRKKKGVADAVVTAIEQELRAQQRTAPAAPVQSAPQMPPAQPAAPVAPQPPTGDMDFGSFMGALASKMGGWSQMQPGPQDYIASLTQRTSQAWQTPLSAITDLAKHPQMIGWVVQQMQADGRW